MPNYIKNIVAEKALDLAALVSYNPGQIVSMTLAQNKAISITIFAFAAGEEISTHESHGDALITALDGSAEITIGSGIHTLKKGESILMPAAIPHAVKATEDYKMLLVVVFPETT